MPSIKQWYLGTAISGLVVPRHTRTLSRTPPLAPASAAFTITATGISAAPATSSLFDLNALSTLEDLPNEYKEDVPVRSAAPIRSAGERLRTSVGEWSAES
eukprot:COSAG03_NODE_2503_length_2693_cov_91.953354_5_plen_101_part_00